MKPLCCNYAANVYTRVIVSYLAMLPKETTLSLLALDLANDPGDRLLSLNKKIRFRKNSFSSGYKTHCLEAPMYVARITSDSVGQFTIRCNTRQSRLCRNEVNGDIYVVRY